MVNAEEFDARSDQVLAGLNIRSIAYDAAGRTTEVVGGADCSVCMQGDGAGIARTYDAENHLLSEPLLQQNPNGSDVVLPTTDMTLSWGLDGHPAAMSQRKGDGSIDSEALHWDGRSVLYTVGSNSSDPTNITIALYIGTLGVVDLQRFNSAHLQAFEITTLDRDESGQMLQRHAADWFSRFDGQGTAWLTPLAKIRGSGSCAPFPAASGCTFAPPGGVAPDPMLQYPAVSLLTVGMARTDGYQMGDVTIQGVRAYDPSIAQWVSPDAYAGTTTDPGSQKPFMWNGNNPIAYSDPSGYEAVCVSLNQPCISRSGITSIVNLVKSVYNNFIGDNVRTLADKNASIGSKLLAVVMLISNFAGPEALASHGLEEIGVRSVLFETGNISKWGLDAAHTLPKSVIDDVLTHGEVIKGPDGYITARAQGKLNGTSGWFEVGGKSTNGTLEIDHASFTRKNRIPGVIR